LPREINQLLLGVFQGGGLALERVLLLLEVFFRLEDAGELGVEQRLPFARTPFPRRIFGPAFGEGLLGLFVKFGRLLVGGQAGAVGDGFGLAAGLFDDGRSLPRLGFPGAPMFPG
jgi:hypothetical protein